jgi:hypothetical protein
MRSGSSRAKRRPKLDDSNKRNLIGYFALGGTVSIIIAIIWANFFPNLDVDDIILWIFIIGIVIGLMIIVAGFSCWNCALEEPDPKGE